MARAKRHFIPGYIWHITHRCHKREFLLKFSKDRHRNMQWLYQARKRNGLAIMDFMVTSNHIHFLVVDTRNRGNVIPKPMKLVAGRTGQDYNQRKNRRGAYWQDRCHATAVESGEHLARCLVYIDTNMVRAGVASHPSKWSFSSYNEIQEPRRKNVLIDYERLQGLLGAGTYEQLRRSHKGWVEKHLGDGATERQDEWTGSIAVGNKSFIENVIIENVKARLGFRAKGRNMVEGIKSEEIIMG
ncbi:MAG: transposase [Desulfobacterales bacterium]